MNPTKIHYLDFTWNPVVGCTPAGEGCRNCYAERAHTMRHKAYKAGRKLPACYSEPFSVVRCLDERLDAPLRRKKPARIGVNFLSDSFHSGVPGDFLDRMFAVMALASQHTFVLLTKRPERMREYMARLRVEKIYAHIWGLRSRGDLYAALDWLRGKVRVLPNVWLGTTVWDQPSAERNIPHLLATPAAVRWVSYEPALGPVNLRHMYVEAVGHQEWCQIDALTGRHTDMGRLCADVPRLSWVVCGGESGSGARPMHPDWARKVRDDCKTAGVPFWFKQHGEWTEAFKGDLPTSFSDERCKTEFACMCNRGPESMPLSISAALIHQQHRHPDHWDAAGNCLCNPIVMRRVGTKAAGNTLDGEVIEQLPEVKA